MTFPKKICNFPPQFYDLACKFNEDNTRVVELQCDDEKQAVSIRLQFYAFRNAARKNGDIKDFPELEGVEVLLRGTVLKFQCKDYNRISEILEAGLAALEKGETE
jgi:hypothetical protein